MSEALFDRVFSAIDAMDSEAFVECLTEDARFRFGSAPAIEGREAIRGAVGQFFDSIADLSHALARTLAHDDALICEGEVTYMRHDGSRITLPFVDVFELEKGLISDYRIYMDIGPLYAT